jgi:predicted anti-sigma-YlaC factor YlaD
MKDAHIIEMLESGPLAALGEDERATIRAHAEGCERCRRAYEAARVSELLLRKRVAETYEPPPFFQTRVLAALRERRAAGEGWSLRRLWRATGALVSSMALTVASLAVLTLFAPNPTALVETQDVAAVSETSATEEFFLDSSESQDAEMTYEQVLTTIYGSDEGATR